MSYPVFEFLALTVGTLSIVVAVLATLSSGPALQETIAQGLLLVVLVGAVHRGRRGGFTAAIMATLAYLAMRLPLILREGLTPDVAGLILVRTLTYGIVGIGGGIVCSRIHHFLARLDSTPNIDPHSQLLNERFISRTLRSRLGEYERFRSPLSVVVVTLEGYPAGDPGPDLRRPLRAVAKYLGDHLRLVDEVARLDDGRLLLVLPHTDKWGAQVASDRVVGGVRRLLAADHESVRAEILGAAEDLPAIRALCGATEPVVDEVEETRASA